MKIETFFHDATWTLTYLVYDEASGDAFVVDPVLDFDPAPMAITTETTDALVERIEQLGLTLHYTLETHAHADHMTGADVLRANTGAKVAAGAKITDVQSALAGLFEMAADAGDFDVLAADGDVLEAGTLSIRAISTPGHTPACTNWACGDAVFTGDTLFMPDFGTGRCDFPGGSAEKLFDSIQKLYALPNATRLFVGHDYQPGGRELAYQTSVGESKKTNEHVRSNTTKEEFVGFRTTRDAALSVPRLILPSLQVNIRAGKLPEPGASGRRFLRMPINVFA
ncbi:MAG: MBL fold metallo-hydrolase [Proteobacteria bacterium]|nr:MBL fold metallo-hydrolase [Pseudomonadota bacterium]MCP4919906.1 MBL fold metallo-hydrolase [Pseudomonadota bacterium]